MNTGVKLIVNGLFGAYYQRWRGVLSLSMAP